MPAMSAPGKKRKFPIFIQRSVNRMSGVGGGSRSFSQDHWGPKGANSSQFSKCGRVFMLSFVVGIVVVRRRAATK